MKVKIILKLTCLVVWHMQRVSLYLYLKLSHLLTLRRQASVQSICVQYLMVFIIRYCWQPPINKTTNRLKFLYLTNSLICCKRREKFGMWNLCYPRIASLKWSIGFKRLVGRKRLCYLKFCRTVFSSTSTRSYTQQTDQFKMWSIKLWAMFNLSHRLSTMMLVLQWTVCLSCGLIVKGWSLTYCIYICRIHLKTQQSMCSTCQNTSIISVTSLLVKMRWVYLYDTNS